MFSKSLLKYVAVSTIGVLAIGQAAEAALTIDLRFATGDPKSKTINAGELTPIVIYAWAIDRGASGNAGREGLQSAMLALQSTLNSAGLSGSLTSGTRSSGWTGSGSQNGAASNLTADGIGDWGSLAPTGASLAVDAFRARTSASRVDTGAQIDFGDQGDAPDNTPTAGVKNALSDGGWEFRLGTFTFTPTAANAAGSVSYTPAVPSQGAGGIGTAGWWEDSTTFATANPPDGGKNNASGTYGPAAGGGVTITVAGIPEPTSLGLAGLAGLGLLRRRRA